MLPRYYNRLYEKLREDRLVPDVHAGWCGKRASAIEKVREIERTWKQGEERVFPVPEEKFCGFYSWYRQGVQKNTCIISIAMTVNLQSMKTRDCYCFIVRIARGRGIKEKKSAFQSLKPISIDIQIGQRR
jgi:hypothetical protein